MSEIVDEGNNIVTTLAVIGFNANGELRCHAPNVDPGRLLFIMEKIKLGMIASMEIRGEERKVLPFAALNGKRVN